MQLRAILWLVEGYLNILKLSYRPFTFISNKAFLKSKKRSGTSLPDSLSAWFLRKNISPILVAEQFSLFGCLYFVRHWPKCMISSKNTDESLEECGRI